MTDPSPGQFPASFFSADPDRPGWMLWRPTGVDVYGGVFNPMWVRLEEEGRTGRCRIEPTPAHGNSRGDVHGGYMMGVVDQAMYIVPLAMGVRQRPAVTLDMNAHFLSPAKTGEALDALVEVTHRTGKMIFLRGLIEQDGRNILSFSGTLRELNAPMAE